jgi:hypothetical protein
MKQRGKPRGRPFRKGYDARRHLLTRAECRKGFAVLLELIAAGKVPSRVAAAIRKKMRQQRIDGPRGRTAWPELLDAG